MQAHRAFDQRKSLGGAHHAFCVCLEDFLIDRGPDLHGQTGAPSRTAMETHELHELLELTRSAL
jgi:hypothetical protein